MRRRLVGAIATGLLCLLCAALYLQATPARLSGAIAPDPADPVFNLYLLRWGAHQAALGFPSFWDANFFHPVKGTVALSDHLLGPAIAFAGLQALGATPALGYNLLLLSSFALGGAALFWIATGLGLSRPAALVASFAYSFALFRWGELSHLQVVLSQWLPWVLWSFDRLLERPGARTAAWFLAAYSLNALGGTYFAYMVHLGLVAILCARWTSDPRRLMNRSALLVLVPVGAAAVAISAAVFVPYLRLRAGLEVEAGAWELNPFRLSLSSLVTTGARTRYADLLPSWLRLRPELWPGFMPLLLLGFALPAPWRRLCAAWRAQSAADRALLVVGVVAMLAALAAADVGTALLDFTVASERRILHRLYKLGGAVLLLGFALVARAGSKSGRHRTPPDPRWRSIVWTMAVAGFAAHPVGYFLLRDVLPGFGSIRVPARLFALAAPGFFLVVGVGVDCARRQWQGRLPAMRRWVPVAALLLVAFEMAPRSRFIGWSSIPAPDRFPAAVQWLGAQPDLGASVEFPLRAFWRESERMYFSTLHFKPLVNGYSGYIPPFYKKVERRLRKLPDAEGVAWFAALGVTHLVVHLDELPRRHRVEVRNWTRQAKRFEPVPARLVFDEGKVSIFRLGKGGQSIELDDEARIPGQ